MRGLGRFRTEGSPGDSWIQESAAKAVNDMAKTALPE